MDRIYKKIDLSIIIPVYNGETTIERCLNTLIIDSDISQEIIIVNDNSTDNSIGKLNDYTKKFPNITTINNKQNLGAGLCRNIGLQKASGDYVGFVDCDDWVDCNLFVTAIEKIRLTKSDIVVFGVRNEYENSYSSKPRYSYSNQITFTTNVALDLLTHGISNNEYISPMVCQKVYKLDFLRKNNLLFTSNRHFEDDVFTFFCFIQKGVVSFIPNVEYHYYQSPHSVSHKISKESVLDFISAFSYIRKQLEEHNRFTNLKKVYFSYLDKSLASFINNVVSEEPNIAEQKKYLSLLFSSMKTFVSLEEILEYLDLSRIIRLWY